MKGFVELSETECREVKGGTLGLISLVVNGIITLVHFIVAPFFGIRIW
jgi:hypothetical protein